MASFINTITGILSLETQRGFNNTSVVGGFPRFINFINKNAPLEDIHNDDIALIADIFSQYPELTVDQRHEAVLACQNWLGHDPKNNRLDWVQPKNGSLPDKKQKTKIEPKSHQDKGLYGPIQSIRGIGEKNSRFFIKLGIDTIYDLLRYFPRRYQDFSQLKTINRLEYGDELSVIGTIARDLYTRSSKKGNMKITEAVLSDGTGTIKLTWFNQPYLSTQLGKDSSIVVSGKVDMYLGRLVMNSPDWEPLDSDQLHTNRIVPLYPLTSGITQRMLRKIIHQNLPFWADRVIEYLPEEILENEKYPGISKALGQIHFPDNTESLNETKDRFAFEEIFFLQLGVLIQKSQWSSHSALKYPLPTSEIKTSAARLPYLLTNSQQSAIKDILADLNSGKPMNRLLQGDVGAGKTVVAKFAIQAVIKKGAQTAVMAPTSILAEQHYRTLTELLVSDELLEPHEIAILIGSTSAGDRKEILKGLADGTIKVIIGTHALLENPVVFHKLQLSIIDEQHRFGVGQRSLLREKGENPHLLVMTATPIPRSLALTVYGDLDVTTISELPPGRMPVETTLYPPRKRRDAYDLIRSQITKGFQAFIVYPLVETEDEEDFKAAVNEYKRLQKDIFPDLKIGLMHGQLKPSEKEDVMLAFREQEYDVLVSTTVIEVGVDIPKATVVLIEGANRFGLAQLHQIRGRVGRSSDKSYCLLIPQDESAIENERLAVMVHTNDGFELAEFDLKQRGPGEFLGKRQSGFASLKYANITNTKLIEKCRKYAKSVFESDTSLSQQENQLLKEQLKFFWPDIQFNINN